ncbi:MAG TPA: hypothetical protein VMT89_18515, partial [Candidatus Acidoferrales bacterium]|nr:hypothetical protein [Candidatus Acidoferrales bacterium]
PTITLSPVPTATPSNTPTQSPSPTPTVAPVCGDGTLEVGEECDDGNALSGDVCPSTPADNCRYSSSGNLIRGNARRPQRNLHGCQVEWYVVNPNQAHDRFGLPSQLQECHDQDPSCDFDPAPGHCRFNVVTCLNNSDPNLPACPANGVSQLRFYRPNSGLGRSAAYRAALTADRAAFEAALMHLLDPQTPGAGYTNQIPIAATEHNQCSQAIDIDIPLLGHRSQRVNLMVRSRDGTPRKYSSLSRLRLLCRQ